MNNAFLVLFLFLCNVGWYVVYLYRCSQYDLLSWEYDAPFHVFAVPLIIAMFSLFICGFVNGFMVWAVMYGGAY